MRHTPKLLALIVMLLPVGLVAPGAQAATMSVPTIVHHHHRPVHHRVVTHRIVHPVKHAVSRPVTAS